MDVVIRNTADAEETLKNYEARLRDVSKVPSEQKEVEKHRSQMKVLLQDFMILGLTLTKICKMNKYLDVEEINNKRLIT